MALPQADVIAYAKEYGNLLISKKEVLISTLITYETHHVANDEFNRTIDVLQHLEENKDFFKDTIDKVISFLPINQPLYALTCFALIPGLMAQEVFVRPPVITHALFARLAAVLDLEQFFPHVHISFQERRSFIEEHRNTAGKTAVIFTGKPENAFAVHKQFGEKVLFIGNGSSHNPVIVAETADLNLAVAGVIEVQLYNQGGDCAAPNAILVAEAVYEDFLARLRKSLRDIKTGSFSDPEVMVGPFHDPKHFRAIRAFLAEEQTWLDPLAPIRIEENNLLIGPAIILKPLVEGGNYKELYAPIFFIQKYGRDIELASYFDGSRYALHAGYITVYGESFYIMNLTDISPLHPPESVIYNTHLHAFGVERGVKPYGGHGINSSFVIFKDRYHVGPTLPQRDIFNFFIKDKEP